MRVCCTGACSRLATMASSSGGEQRLVADGGPDAQPRLVQPALEGGLAGPRDLGGLLRGQPFDVAQHDRDTQRWRQLGYGAAEGGAQLARLGPPQRVVSGRRGQLQLPLPDGDASRPAGPLLERAVGLVDRDPVEPGEVAGPAMETADALPGSQ